MSSFNDYFSPAIDKTMLTEVAMSGFAAYPLANILAFINNPKGNKKVELVPDRGTKVTISWEKVDLAKFANSLAEKLQTFAKNSAMVQKMDNAAANKYFADIPGLVATVG